MTETKVKICGIRRTEDITYVNAAQPDYTGFIFAEGRRRTITPDRAAELVRRLSPAVTPVGVFVDAAPELIADMVKKEIVRMVQLHGHEDGAYILGLKEKLRQSELPKVTKTVHKEVKLSGLKLTFFL